MLVTAEMCKDLFPINFNRGTNTKIPGNVEEQNANVIEVPYIH